MSCYTPNDYVFFGQRTADADALAQPNATSSSLRNVYCGDQMAAVDRLDRSSRPGMSHKTRPRSPVPIICSDIKDLVYAVSRGRVFAETILTWARVDWWMAEHISCVRVHFCSRSERSNDHVVVLERANSCVLVVQTPAYTPGIDSWRLTALWLLPLEADASRLGALAGRPVRLGVWFTTSCSSNPVY